MGKEKFRSDAETSPEHVSGAERQNYTRSTLCSIHGIPAPVSLTLRSHALETTSTFRISAVCQCDAVCSFFETLHVYGFKTYMISYTEWPKRKSRYRFYR